MAWLRLGVAVWSLIAIAQPRPSLAESRAQAVRRTTAISIDGQLTESAWGSAPHQSGFTQRFPKDGVPAEFATSFAVLYDNDAIYVGVWATDPKPDEIRPLLTRRDIDSASDTVAVAIDSYHDRRTAYLFALNAAGVQRDALVFDDSNADSSWDAVWTGASSRNASGWCAEFRIPLNQLRFANGSDHQWGLQVVRSVARTQEESAWSPWPRSGSQIVSRFGVVDGITNVSQGRRLELLPYLSGGVERQPVEMGDPLNDATFATGSLGLDAKYGLGPAFTLSATINPDFGQVEADPSRVNLSANELFFEERRPFFVEGADLFKLSIGPTNNGTEGAFYSRRIGAAPQGGASGDYVNAPDAVTILGAAKLTGKTKSGWSIGMLDAITSKETAEVVSEGVKSEPVVSPLTNYAVARVKRDFRAGQTTIGASATAVHRALDGTGLESLLHDQAYSLGAQFDHRWGNNAWDVNVGVVGSYVHGSPQAIERTQRSQVHLFQRPDDRFVLDPTRTSLAGMGMGWIFGKVGDTKRWRYGLGGEARSAELELNDVGFQRNANSMVTFYFVEVHDEEPGKYLLNYRLNTDVFTVNNFEPLLTDYGFEANGNAQTANYWNAFFNLNLIAGPWATGLLRGGPMRMRWDPSYNLNTSLSSDQRRRVRVNVGGSINGIPAQDTIGGGLDVSAEIQARSNIDISVGPSWSRGLDAMQFVSEATDDAGLPHYVFARIDQSTVGMTVRLNWTFSPKLSLQAYAQPFLATGRYSQYKDVDNPGARKFTDRFTRLDGNKLSLDDMDVFTANNNGVFQFGRPDFSFAALRSNVVVRWEYRPGSTLFAIWSHGQTTTGSDGRFALDRDLRSLAERASEDIVLLKLNYWIGL